MQRLKFESGGTEVVAEGEQASAQPASEQNQQIVYEEAELPLDPNSFPLERYKPLTTIGKGASSIVYLCRDRLLGKKVAVKCLRSVNVAQLLNFQKEAKATSQLNHPNIIRILDFGGTPGGAPYMIMEYFRGISLERYLELHGPMSAALVLEIFAKICRALEHAHERGIYHRDLKSSNILFFEDDKDVRVIDFGVAIMKRLHQEQTIIDGRTIVGTPGYMSPDQAFGLPYTSSSEIYSLGCVMFEAITGRLPFVGSTALETIGMHAHDPVPLISYVNPSHDAPRHLEETIYQCLAKTPDERFQTMTEVLLALGGERELDQSESLQLPAPKNSANFFDDKTAGLDIARTRGFNKMMVVLFAATILGPALWVYKGYSDEERARQLQNGLEESANRDVRAALTAFGQGPSYKCGDDSTVTISWGDNELLSKVGKTHDIRHLNIINSTISEGGFMNLDTGSIRSLSIEKSTISDQDLAVLRKFSALRSLTISQCKLKGAFLKYISELPIESLNLIDVPLTADSFKSIGLLSKLRRLHIEVEPRLADTVASEGLCHLRPAPQQIEQIVLFGFTPSQAAMKNMLIIMLPRLESVEIGEGLCMLNRTPFLNQTQMTESTVREHEVIYQKLFPLLSKAPRLKMLQIDLDIVADSELKEIPSFANLQNLSFSATHYIPLVALGALSKSHSLVSLEITGPCIDGKSLAILRMPRLHSLSLSRTNISGNDLLKIDLPMLENLRLVSEFGVRDDVVLSLVARKSLKTLFYLPTFNRFYEHLQRIRPGLITLAPDDPFPPGKETSRKRFRDSLEAKDKRLSEAREARNKSLMDSGEIHDRKADETRVDEVVAPD